jgi:hypothetical protein
MEGTKHHGMAMPLSAEKFAYSIVQQASTNPDLTLAQELDPFLEPIWAQGSLADIDSLDLVFPSDEVIIEVMTGPDRPWDDLHHRSYFLLELRRIEADELMLTMIGDRSFPINSLAMHAVYAEGNMETIAKMIPINIYRTPDVMENVFVGENCSLEEVQIYMGLFKQFCDVFAWSYDEIPSIDPRIIEHEIMTYPDAKPVWQKLRLVNPKKATNIKAEVEKLLKDGFI